MIAEDSVRFAHSGPSHNLLRPAIAELVSCGPSCPRLVNVKEGPSDISYRVTKRSSDRTLARPPCLQVPQSHPRVTKGGFLPVFGTATLPTGTSVASSRGKGVFWTDFGTATLPTGTSVASSRSHFELVYQIVALLGFVKFTWHELLLIIK